MVSRKTDLALICRGGPSGLAAAIMLHQMGWQKIILVERGMSKISGGLIAQPGLRLCQSEKISFTKLEKLFSSPTGFFI